ncbi:MAG: protein-export chaperone SecB [Pseudomonadota bacterium]|nr:protein-export chaperone SecB [Pseudomonadota bacterium]
MNQAASDPDAANGKSGAQGGQLSIRKLYLKDLSFESPAAPGLFSGQVNPEININLGATSSALGGDDHEVVVTATVEAKKDDSVLFLVEVHQAGVFQVRGVDQQQLAWALGVTCPNILFPYVRQVISDMTVAGGMPPLLLNPVNFEALYRQHLAEADAKGQSGNGESPVTH